MTATGGTNGGGSSRLALVQQHVAHENAHDLDAVMSTFTTQPVYEDRPEMERHAGTDAVRRYYARLLAAIPDLNIDIQHAHEADTAIVLEVTISGTHLGGWRGLPATGRRLRFPLCAVYTFSADERLAGERIYYDRAQVLGQLGVFREPDTRAGRLLTVLNHPVVVGRAVARASRLAVDGDVHDTISEVVLRRRRRGAVPRPPGTTTASLTADGIEHR